MARTIATAVEGILLDHYDSANSPSLTPFIDTANDVVTRVATCATARGVTLSSTTLELIERWLATHFYAIADLIAKEKETGDARAIFYGSEDGEGLEFTPYGKQAVVIDYSGCLKTVSKGHRGVLTWLGKPPSEQTDYVDRD